MALGRAEELEEALARAAETGDRKALKLLERFERKLRKKWRFCEDRAKFEARVARTLQRDLDVARAWKDDLEACRSPEARVARLVEFERTAHLSPGAYRIYCRGLDVDDAGADDFEPLTSGELVRAYIGIAFALVAPAYYLLAFATSLGPSASAAWLTNLGLCTLFLAAVVEPLRQGHMRVL